MSTRGESRRRRRQLQSTFLCYPLAIGVHFFFLTNFTWSLDAARRGAARRPGDRAGRGARARTRSNRRGQRARACIIAFNFYQMIVRRNTKCEKYRKIYHGIAWGVPSVIGARRPPTDRPTNRPTD